MRVLVVEDERLLADTVAEGLRRLAMAVDVCYDGTRRWSESGCTATTWWCWTAICPACTATRCAGR